jgi:general secretion pathway protein M
VLLSVGGVLVALAILWGLALAPALRTWQEAPARQAQLDAQTQRMRQLQAQAQALQARRTLPRSEAVQWLQNSMTELGPDAQVTLQGDRATVRVQAAPADALARWLSQARENAQALPVQAELQLIDGLWRGNWVLQLP